MGAAGVACAAGRDGAGRGGSRDRSSAALSRRSVPVSVVSAPAQPNRRTMGTLGARRGLEWLLGFYFLSHIPITLLMDLQGVLPRDLYPVEVRAPSVPVAGVGVPCRSRCPSVPITSPPRASPTQGSLPLSLGSAGALYLDILGFSLFLPAASPRLQGGNTFAPFEDSSSLSLSFFKDSHTPALVSCPYLRERVWMNGLPRLAQWVKNPRDAGDMGLIPGSGRSSGGGNGNPLSILAWKIPGTGELGGLQSLRVRRHWAHTHSG